MPEWSPLDLVPGLYAAAMALLLAGALRRWYDAVPAWAMAAFGAVVCLLFGGALFGGRVLLPLDNLRGEVPWLQVAAARPPGNPLQGDLLELVAPSLAAAQFELQTGRWPLWSSYVGAGMPLLADPQSQALSPLALLALPFSPLRGAAVLAALRVWLALTFTFLLLRRQGMGGGPALAGALAFGLSGFVILWVGWPLASVAALLPAVLYALARVAAPAPAAEDRRRDAVLLAAALAALLLAGHPETVLYACLLAAAFACSLARRLPPGLRAGVLRRTVAAAAVAAGLAAPALLPALDYLPQTLRAERLAHPAPPAAAAEPAPAADSAPPGAGTTDTRSSTAGTTDTTSTAGTTDTTSTAGTTDTTSTAGKSGNGRTGGTTGAAGGARTGGFTGASQAAGDLARRWLPIAAPNAYGNSRYYAYWGLLNSNEDAAGFAGTAALLGAALAAASAWRRRRQLLPQEGLMLAVLALCLVLLADPAPLHAAVATVAPALAGSRRCLLLVAFSLAWLFACTCERQRRGDLGRLPLLAAAAVLAALLAWAYVAHPNLADPGQLAILRFGWLRWQLRFLIGATLLLALPARRIRPALSSRDEPAATDTGAPDVAQPSQGSPGAAEPRRAASMPPGPQVSRVTTGVRATMGAGGKRPTTGALGTTGTRAMGTLAARAATAGGLALLAGAELLLANGSANPPMPMRLAFPTPPPLAAVAGRLGGDRIAALGRGLPPNLAWFYQMVDVRIYNPMAPAPYMRLLAPIVAGWWGEVPELGSPGHPLYRRLGVCCLLAAPGQRLPPPWQLAVADRSGWLYRRTDVWQRLYVLAAGGRGEPILDALRVLDFSDDRIACETRSAAPGALLGGSLYQDGGWRLLIDGRRAAGPPARRLLEVPLPQGRRRLDLLYRPRGFLAGLLAAALACAAGIAAWAPPPGRRAMQATMER
jgi:hypothetical protein